MWVCMVAFIERYDGADFIGVHKFSDSDVDFKAEQTNA